MNNNIYPCVWFESQGSEAAKFYCDIFPNTTITEDNGMVQMLSINGQKLMFLTAGPQFQVNPSISFLIANEDEKETERLYKELLKDGGLALMELASYPFSKKYGWVKDKYGITWQLYTGDKGNTDQYFVPTLMFIHDNNGRAREAIDFYTKLFPNSSVEGIMTYADGQENDVPENIQHAQFTINGYTLACMDNSHDHPFDFDEGLSITVMTNDQKETDYYWDNFVKEGGEESMCGWCKDKFGVSWQIVPQQLLELGINNKDKAQGKKVFEEMMKMKKIVIADLEKAAASS